MPVTTPHHSWLQRRNKLARITHLRNSTIKSIELSFALLLSTIISEVVSCVYFCSHYNTLVPICGPTFLVMRKDIIYTPQFACNGMASIIQTAKIISCVVQVVAFPFQYTAYIPPRASSADLPQLAAEQNRPKGGTWNICIHHHLSTPLQPAPCFLFPLVYSTIFRDGFL